uniref:Coiled-coil glutamate rich protein 1 n=1 Tax=Propithecus coquereli TaxID=379532 RepID=A0A2K6F6B4_PROCO
MNQTLNTREDPLNLAGGWASSAPLRTWSSYQRRRRGAPIYKRRHRYGPKAEYEPPGKQPRQQYGPGSRFQPPVCSNWGSWRGPWHPPPGGFWKPPGPMQVIRVYGLHPFCLCCCSCWRGPWNPGWARPPGRKKRWGHRGRRHPRRSSPRSPPVDLRTLLRPVNLYRWRAPGMRAPQNTTQFIMNQIYEDMRQQEELERQQEALRAEQAQAGGQASPGGSSGNDAPPSGSEDDPELPETLYGFGQNPALALSPAPEEENQYPAPQLVEEEEEEEEKNEEEECAEDLCDGKEEESEEEEEEEAEEEEEEEGMEEPDYLEEGEEEEEDEEEELEEEEQGLEEDEQRAEENHLPLEMPLSILVGAEAERENYINCTYLSSEQIFPEVPQETLLMVQDING